MSDVCKVTYDIRDNHLLLEKYFLTDNNGRPRNTESFNGPSIMAPFLGGFRLRKEWTQHSFAARVSGMSQIETTTVVVVIWFWGLRDHIPTL